MRQVVWHGVGIMVCNQMRTDMKRIVLLMAIATGVVMTSCNTGANKEMEAKLQAQAQTIEEMKLAMDRQHLIDSMSQAVAMQKA